MSLFGQKETKEYNDLNEFFEKTSELLSTDKYISKMDFISFANSSKESYESLNLMDEKNVLSAWCKQNRIDIKAIKKYLEAYKTIEVKIKEHNDLFVKNHLKLDKDYLDKILIKDDPHIMLDEEQRRVVLSDEDYTLVIAGAGAGKTTTIEAKVKYLIDKQNVSPDRVLIVKPVRDKDGSDTGERMLGCTNYKKDGTGCNFNMLNRNYTRDKTKILKTDDGRIMKDNFKSVILNVFNSIKEIYKCNTKFRFNVKALADYLNGADSKIIQAFKLNEIGNAYGIFKEKSSYVSFKFINVMVESGLLNKVKNGSYENLDLNVESV